MGNFRAKAIAAVSSSSVTAGRIKVQIKDVAKQYPDGITITDFDIFSKKEVKKDKESGELKEIESRFAVIAFEENSAAYFNGGTMLTKIIKSWASDYGYSDGLPLDDADNAGAIYTCKCAYLEENDLIKVKLYPDQPLSDGTGTFTMVEVV